MDAIKYTGDNLEEVGVFTNGSLYLWKEAYDTPTGTGIFDSFTDSLLVLNTQEYVIRDAQNGGFFILEADYFERFFEEVEAYV